MITCHDIEQRYERDDFEASGFDAECTRHIDSCPHCRELFLQINSVDAKLQALPDVDMPPAVASAILSAVKRPKKSKTLRVWLSVSAGSVSLAAAAAVLLMVQQRRAEDSTSLVSTPVEALAEPSQPEEELAVAQPSVPDDQAPKKDGRLGRAERPRALASLDGVGEAREAEVDLARPNPPADFLLSPGGSDGTLSHVVGSVGVGSGLATSRGFAGLGMSERKGIYPSAPPPRESSAESYASVASPGFVSVSSQPLSTFSIDVDTASYSNVRRYLDGGSLPPPQAVRIEELINYFPYADAPPSKDDARPFAVHTEVAECPWNKEHKLVRVALKGKEVSTESRPASNLVFLVDVSGSMQDANKLPLLKESLRLLVERLDGRDTLAMVVYAGSAGVVLEPTSGREKEKIYASLDALQAGGSTNGEAGIVGAYALAAKHFVKGGINRVILATDGDFNVGVSSADELLNLVGREAKSGIFLTALGFGMGNLKDDTLERLADKGNGNYAYVDTLAEAKKVLVEQQLGTLVTIAKDVKIQVEFNPAKVGEYRLVGYDNRRLATQDFRDDTKDAGDIGAGHSVVALYEIVPAGQSRAGEPLKYQPVPASSVQTDTGSPELLTVRLRYKLPEASQSVGFKKALLDSSSAFSVASTDFRFGAAVAWFGMGLSQSEYRGGDDLGTLYRSVEKIAGGSLGADSNGHRKDFLRLVRQAKALSVPSNARPLGVQVVGALPPETVQRVMDRVASQVRYCYEKGLAQGEVSSGRLELAWTVSADGTTSAVRVKRSDLNSPSVEVCVVRVIERLRFPPPAGGGLAEVSYPFVFSTH